MKLSSNRSCQAITLPEVMITVLLLATFFASVFELNAVCLRYINASKENVAALQYVSDRVEVIRNLSFTDLTTTSKIQTLLSSAPNASDFNQKATEVVRLSAYPTPNGVTQFTRSPNGTVTLNSTATSLGTRLVQVEVSSTWTMTLSGRSRSEQITTLISNGTKK